MTPTVEIYEARRGIALRKQWRWRIRAANGRIVANGGEGYNNRTDLLRALKIAEEALECHFAQKTTPPA